VVLFYDGGSEESQEAVGRRQETERRRQEAEIRNGSK
jgi:hypothetical protein